MKTGAAAGTAVQATRQRLNLNGLPLDNTEKPDTPQGQAPLATPVVGQQGSQPGKSPAVTRKSVEPYVAATKGKFEGEVSAVAAEIAHKRDEILEVSLGSEPRGEGVGARWAERRCRRSGAGGGPQRVPRGSAGGPQRGRRRGRSESQ